MSDSSFEELHAFAGSLGIPRVAFQGDHYDLHEAGRDAALVNGAVRTPSRELVKALNIAGLRRGPSYVRGGLSAVAALPAPLLETERLILRQWTAADIDPLHAIESDPVVMTYLGGPLTKEATARQVESHAVTLALRGMGQWAVQLRTSGELIGRCGVSAADPVLPFAPALELGARLGATHQHHGLGTEAAAAALHYGFCSLEVARIVAFAAIENVASRSTMARLGMVEQGEFDHPRYAPPLRRQVVAWIDSVAGIDDADGASNGR